MVDDSKRYDKENLGGFRWLDICEKGVGLDEYKFFW